MTDVFLTETVIFLVKVIPEMRTAKAVVVKDVISRETYYRWCYVQHSKVAGVFDSDVIHLSQHWHNNATAKYKFTAPIRSRIAQIIWIFCVPWKAIQKFCSNDA